MLLDPLEALSKRFHRGENVSEGRLHLADDLDGLHDVADRRRGHV